MLVVEQTIVKNKKGCVIIGALRTTDNMNNWFGIMNNISICYSKLFVRY